MNPLLQQFLSEARDFLQGIGEKLMQLEKAPNDASLVTELFRLVHTLKGNSGLFEFPEMTRVLHAAEDLMDAVRQQQIAYSRELADRLLDAMDFVGMLCDDIEATGALGATYASDSASLSESLRQLLMQPAVATPTAQEHTAVATVAAPIAAVVSIPGLLEVPEDLRMQAFRQLQQDTTLHWITYAPAEECFFQGEDPLFQARQTPALLWGGVHTRETLPPLVAMDAYRCLLDFQMLSAAPLPELADYFRYMAEYIEIQPVSAPALIIPVGDPNGGPIYEDFVRDALVMLQAGDLHTLSRAAQTMLTLSNPDLWLSSAIRWLLLVIECAPEQHALMAGLITAISRLEAPDWTTLMQAQSPAPQILAAEPRLETPAQDRHETHTRVGELFAIQREILRLPLETAWHFGRLQGAVSTLAACLAALGNTAQLPALQSALAEAVEHTDTSALLLWLDAQIQALPTLSEAKRESLAEPEPIAVVAAEVLCPNSAELSMSLEADLEPKFGRRVDDVVAGAKSLKVDQVKIDRLMNLIGEMVVSKNALPYLAARAEEVFGVRELSREIKTQYAVINRIAEEMQDAIMQVRMLPVSFVFQRFPRLVRDVSRKLGKDVNLILEGEDTEADKNIIEALGDPLVHIVRNSLDHGFELPEVRKAAGKPASGTLIIRAMQESDRAIIEIIDDGKGIDPEAVKRKAYEKGILDEAGLERISAQEAVNLVFAPGFSTAEVISDLSGRGVGMDVVRNAIETVNGSIVLESEVGKGTRIRLSLPLSMAVTNVMIIESDGQHFGVSMDSVVETVRVPRSQLTCIKHNWVTVLRGRIVPLKSLNELLALNVQQTTNDDNEFAVLVVRLGDEVVGLMVDNFHETVDIILKPMSGIMSEIAIYAGSALMGDGSVLMVLNIKELLA